MAIQIRKTLLQVESVWIEGGRASSQPLTLYTAAAVVTNPWAGRGYVEDLRPEIHAAAPVLGELLTKMIIDAVGSGAAVEGYGKAAVVGLDGELEHASALIHTLRFGNHYREAVGAKSYLAFCNTRGGANAPILIPLMDKNDEGRRSHYLTIQTELFPTRLRPTKSLWRSAHQWEAARTIASATAIRIWRRWVVMLATLQRL